MNVAWSCWPAPARIEYGPERSRTLADAAILGPRASVFSGYPHALYLPPRSRFRVVAQEPTELADGRAPARKRFAPRLIRPEDCGFEIRGGGNATRQIVDILPPSAEADRLLVCEVFTPAGNWSSYPPHKHDVDRPPGEVKLEEIYYYRFAEPRRVWLSTPLRQAIGSHPDGVARRRRADSLRLPPVCDGARLQRLLLECARRHPAIDGGERRSPLRGIPEMAGARSPRAGRRTAGAIDEWSMIGHASMGGLVMSRRMCRVLTQIALAVCLAAPAFAQVDRATLTGIVKDPSGAVIARAQVKITSLATNSVNTTVANSEGSYLVVNLAPGEYLVQVEAPGFQRFEQTVALELGARSRLDVSLAVGSVGETVTVQGVTPLLSTESAVVGTVSIATRWPSCRWRSATGTTCCRWCPACRAIAIPSRPAARRRAAPAASACTAIAACRTTSCSTASPTTVSRPTCRS